jgi:hypothetical protein
MESHCRPLDFFGFSSTLCRPLGSLGCNLDLVIVSTEAVDSAGVLPLGSLTFYISVLNQPSPNACLLFRLQVKHFTNVCSPGRFDQIQVVMFLGRGDNRTTSGCMPHGYRFQTLQDADHVSMIKQIALRSRTMTAAGTVCRIRCCGMHLQ